MSLLFLGREKRSQSRVVGDFDLTYGYGEDDQRMTTGIEISESGLRFRSEGGFASGQKLFIQLLSTDEEVPSTIEVEVKHSTSDCVGAEFVGVTKSGKAAILKLLQSLSEINR